MDFFNANDWLSRPGPKYAFKLDHILFIVIAMLIGVGLCFLLHKKNKNTVHLVLVILWAIAVGVEVIYYGVTYAQCIIDPVKYQFNIETMLPFHSCLMFLYVFPFSFLLYNVFVFLCRPE